MNPHASDDSAAAEEHIDEQLLEAVQEDNLALVQTLLAKGANPNYKEPDGVGNTTLYWACKDAEMLRCLIEHGATVEAEDSEDGSTSMHEAAEHGNVECLQLLFGAGGRAALERFDFINRTPLIRAVDAGHVDAVKYLIAQGANVDANDEPHIGYSVMDRAVDGGHLEIVRILLEAGADPTIRTWMQLDAIDGASSRDDDVGRQMLALFESHGWRAVGPDAP